MYNVKSFLLCGKTVPFSFGVGNAKASFSPMDGNRLRRSVDFKRWFRPVYYTYYHRQIVDMGIKDANNMGAAMAPAAVDTIVTHFKDTGFTPESYDLILTGDLGAIGREICVELTREQGFNIENIYNDCGLMIYDREKQDTHAGGSGCGCAATVFAGFVYKKLMDGTLKMFYSLPQELC